MADDEDLVTQLRHAQLEVHRSKRKYWSLVIAIVIVIGLALVCYNTQEGQRDLWSDVVGGLVAGLTIASFQLVTQEHVRRRTEVRRLMRELREEG